MNLKQNHYSRRALALLLTLVMCVGMIPTAFAAQQAEDAREEPEEAPAEEAAPADDYPTGDPFAREDLDATRRINLDDLKFGRNYTGE